MTSSCLCSERHAPKKQVSLQQEPAPDARLVHAAHCGSSPCTTSLIKMLQQLPRAIPRVTLTKLYYSKTKKGIDKDLPLQTCHLLHHSQCSDEWCRQSNSNPGAGHFLGKPFKQIWEEESAAQEPLVSRAPQEAEILEAPLPIIEISCLSLTNPFISLEASKCNREFLILSMWLHTTSQRPTLLFFTAGMCAPH